MDSTSRRPATPTDANDATQRRDVKLPSGIDKTNVGYRTPRSEGAMKPPSSGSGVHETLAVAPTLEVNNANNLSLNNVQKPPSFLGPPKEDGEIGRLANYRVLGTLGTGGMGVVYHAEDLVLRRPVALKIIRPDLQEKEEGWHRLQREARAMASIKHENLITVYNAGQEGEVFYVAMELLEGETLDARLDRIDERLEISEILRLSREIASGLSAIHKHGMIHRDLKPSNIWLEGPEAKVRILDFGLARTITKSERTTNLTQAGTLVGTPAYMSPEQARGETLDARSDLFSLGCVMYCLCSGAPPFKGESLIAQLTALAVDDPKPLREVNPSIPKPLADLIEAMLIKKPAGRPASADEIIDELNAIESGGTARTQIAPKKLVDARRNAKGHKKEFSKEWAALAATIMLAVLVGALLVVKPWAKNPPNDPNKQIAQADPKVQPDVPDKVDETKNPDVKTPEPKITETKLPDPKIPQSTPTIDVAQPQKVDEPPPKEDPPRRTPGERRPPLEQPPPDERPDQVPDVRPPRREPEGAADAAKMVKAQVAASRGPGKAFATDLPFADFGSAFFPKGSGKEKYNDKFRPPDAYTFFSVAGQESPHAIGTHPGPGGREGFCEIKLDGKYKKFYAVVSQNDGVPEASSEMTMAVYGDDKKLWTSKPFRTQRGTQVCQGIDVAGVKVLSLEITCKGSPNAAHGIWFEPYLEK